MTVSLHLIDTHAHLALDHYTADRDAVITRAAAAGVARMIEIGYDLDSSRAAVHLASQHPTIFAVVGIQPNHVHTAPADWSVQLRALAAQDLANADRIELPLREIIEAQPRDFASDPVMTHLEACVEELHRIATAHRSAEASAP